MTGGTRTPTWKERENNKCRERRRRAVAAKIFTGLRLHGNFTLPKHCDNNEVLKALCFQAGWTVEPDGTTYRRGSKPVHNMGMMGGGSGSGSRPGSACSYQQSPSTSSYNPSPAADADATPLIPWLRSLTSSAASSSTFAHHHPHGGSISAPVTPPSASPTADWDGSYARLDWGGSSYPFLPFSTPPSPGPRPWYPGARIPQSGSTSPTFSLLSSNPRSGSLVCTPGRQSGTCSPAVAISDAVNIPNIGGKNTSLVKPWEGETIHEECGSDELELTLGSSKPR